MKLLLSKLITYNVESLNLSRQRILTCVLCGFPAYCPHNYSAANTSALAVTSITDQRDMLHVLLASNDPRLPVSLPYEN